MSIDRAINIATLGVCLAISLHLGNDWLRKREARLQSEASAARYKSGDVVGDTRELALSSARSSLLLITTSSCQYCTSSMDSFRKIVNFARDSGIRVVALTPEDPPVNEFYLKHHGIQADTVLSLQKNNVALGATPTLLLVNQQGRVIDLWIGEVKGDRESVVLKRLASVS